MQRCDVMGWMDYIGSTEAHLADWQMTRIEKQKLQPIRLSQAIAFPNE